LAFAQNGGGNDFAMADKPNSFTHRQTLSADHIRPNETVLFFAFYEKLLFLPLFLVRHFMAGAIRWHSNPTS
jgi:hypothetical protein